MTPLVVAFCLAFAAVTLAVAAGTAIGTLGARLMRSPAAARLGARTRASLLAQLRLAPLGLVLPVGLVVQLAFWRFEPAQSGERAGPLLAVLTVLGTLALLLSVARVARASRATSLVRRQWRNAALPTTIPGWRGPAYRVDSAFPVVAVLGVWRPELFVATHVAEACTPGEIAVVAAHEHAHVAARDNLMRAAFAATPFVGSAADWLERAWAAAAEEAADLTARRGGSGVTLAAALVKVASLAMPVEPRPALASALIGAGTLERRVRRLLDSATPSRPRRLVGRLGCDRGAGGGLVPAVAAGVPSSRVRGGLRPLTDYAPR